MLTKIIGTNTTLTLTTSPQTVTVSTNEYGTYLGQLNQNLPPVKVRIAASGACYIAFGTTATTNSLLMPANAVEHFKLDGTNTVSVLGVAASGNCSVTAVA